MSEMKKGLSRNALKWIGFGCLLIGSLGSILIKRGIMKLPTMTNEQIAPLIAPGGALFPWAVTAVATMLICSIAVPVYAKLFSESWEKTSDRKAYMIRMAILALVSEFIYDWSTTGHLINMTVQNPLWALLVAAMVLAVFGHYDQPGAAGVAMKVSAVIASVLWVVFLGVDMGIATVLLVSCFSLLPKDKKWPWLCAIAAALTQYTAPLGVLIVALYREEGSAGPKWVHYALYPATMLLLGIAASILQ